MESEAPPMPMLLLPEVATTREAKAYFDWEDIKRLSSVTYTLQIASDKDFTTIMLEKKGLTNSKYTIVEEEKLKLTKLSGLLLATLGFRMRRRTTSQ
jgi:hypothetical protein